jgi:hypothetical protein
MNENKVQQIGPLGRWLIFLGVPVAMMGVLLVSIFRHGLASGLANAVGERALPYVVFFTPVVFGAMGLVLYKCLPARLVIPLGIIGWVIGLSLIYWYFWFGPGAFKLIHTHHS